MQTLLVSLAILALLLYFMFHKKKSNTSTATFSPVSQPHYPYRPDVERRLPDGCITTDGYAAQHPSEFAHWGCGPVGVLGENIDPTDWENWRVNYWGMDD